LRILVTRAEEDARGTAERLARLGHQAVIASVIAIAPTNEPPPQTAPDALLLTSVHGVPVLSGLDPGVPVFAVGTRTAQAARLAGMRDVREAAGDAGSLAALVRATLPSGADLLHVAGRDRKPEPGASLAAAGYGVSVWEAYAAEAALTLPEAARSALSAGVLDIALHYSRRSAGLLLALAEEAGLREPLLALHHLCLSEDVAAPLREAGAPRIRVATRPEERFLFAAIDPNRGDAA
jgi:uroporphyrinogen-III synthase